MAAATRPSVVYSAKEGQRFEADTSLQVVDCPTCHVTYAIPESFYRTARKYNSAANPNNHWTICCPFGHSWWYSGLDKEQQLRQSLKWAREDAARNAAERDQAKASARAEKAAKTRIRNQRDRERTRVANGVCPCCNRTFQNLGRHMASQHPDHATPEMSS